MDQKDELLQWKETGISPKSARTRTLHVCCKDQESLAINSYVALNFIKQYFFYFFMIFVTSGKPIKDLEIQLYIDTNSTVDDCNMNSLVFNVDKIKWLNMVSKKKKPPDNQTFKQWSLQNT